MNTMENFTDLLEFEIRERTLKDMNSALSNREKRGIAKGLKQAKSKVQEAESKLLEAESKLLEAQIE